MGNPFGPVPGKVAAKIGGFTGSVVLLCPCGDPAPVLVPVVLTSFVQAECQSCGRRFTISRIRMQIHDKQSADLDIGVVMTEPTIARPSPLALEILKRGGG